MGTVIATLLLAEPNTTRVNATLFIGELEMAGPAKPGARAVCAPFYCSARRVSCFPGSPNPCLA